ncbi:MAG: helix-turn-helix domain-containing protein [Lachnospiraceae bacterium]
MNYKTFYITDGVEYKEANVKQSIINKVYEIKNSQNIEILAIPDGCIDLQYVKKDGKAWYQLCGSFEKGQISELSNYDYCFGVKFNPGRLSNIVNANEYVGKRYTIYEELDIQNLKSGIKKMDHVQFEEKVDYVCQQFKEQRQTEEIEMIQYVIDRVNEGRGALNISELIEKMGYSHCYTERLFKKEIGFSIKKYSNIIRLQKSIDYINQNNIEDVYEKLGFYDQSHFINEFKKFTSMTPKRYEKRAVKFV